MTTFIIIVAVIALGAITYYGMK